MPTKMTFFRAIEILARKNEIFDIIFLDPPYKENISTKTIEKISEEKSFGKGWNYNFRT